MALPVDDDYLFRLGVALYGFSSINSFMIEIICHIDKTQSGILLLDKTSGVILDIFRKTQKKIESEKLYPETSINQIMDEVAYLFKALNTKRTDFVHAYPITGIAGKQILHRRYAKDKYFEIGDSFLDDFIRSLVDVSSGLYKIRNIVGSNL
jgi:hypothetical protein